MCKIKQKTLFRAFKIYTTKLWIEIDKWPSFMYTEIVIERLLCPRMREYYLQI